MDPDNFTHIGDNWLHLRQGSHTNSLKRSGKLHADVTFSPPVGRVVRLDDDTGEFHMGLESTLNTPQIPFLIDRGPGTRDVFNPTGNPATNSRAWGNPNVDGTIYTICLLDAYEIEVTEFASEDSVGAYTYNMPLKADASDTVLATGGLITPGTYGDETTIGYVSQLVGPLTSDGVAATPGRDYLGFITHYHPKSVA